MRRRNQLQVNTFPFLAVLLCAMGSLILILLVMDRRARMAADQRGRDEAGRTLRERAEAIALREQDHARKQGEVKTAYDRKKAELKARLDAEQRALDGDMRQIQARLAEIARELRSEEELVGKLRTNVRTEQVRLTRHEQALETARKEAADLGGKLSNGDRARHKLAADMVQLEQIIRDLQASRKSDAMTYSVVPYKGKQGEKRRPLYLECSASGLVFHPDKLTLTDPPISSIQEEITRRATHLAEQRKKAGMKEERAYLMMLVRPNGIKRYYQVQSAIHDLPVEFGYEFVDEDWTLTFPEGGDLAEATTLPEDTKPEVANPPKVSVGRITPGDTGGTVGGGVGTTGGLPGVAVTGTGALPGVGTGVPGGVQGGAGTGLAGLPADEIGVPGGVLGGQATGVGTMSGDGASTKLRAPGGVQGGAGTSIVGVPGGGTGVPGGLRGGSTTGTGSAIGTGATTGASLEGNAKPGAPGGNNAMKGDASAQLSRPQPYGEGPDLELGLPTGVGAKGSPSTGDAPANLSPLAQGSATNGAMGSSSTQNAVPPTGATSPPGETPLIRLPSVLPGSVAAGGSLGTSSEGVTNATRKPNGPAFQGPDLGPAKPRTFPLLPARVGGADQTIVFIECLSDGVVLHPSGTSYSIDSLNHSPAHNPLYQAVVARLAKHTGDPKNRSMRFLIHRDGERTFHLAYPVFNSLGVTKTRYSLQSDDDVSRIVAGD